MGWRCFQFAVLLLATLLEAVSARGELVLADYSPVHPIKIMAVGDSITDDCVTGGAWRQYLEPLLDANGYPFVFVGRQASTPSSSFTQILHEGYCGAVIAGPGVLNYAVHGYAGTNVYLQMIVLDALTNTTPDLVLLVIGVNDIGRGRDPAYVATNDMPRLLDTILSNAPNANIILAKVTSLVDATLPGYGTNATNIYIYNAALEAMVNQRRAWGQNVFLADMFSVVGHNWFNSDHVHPNTAGLQAMAREWLARIQAITISSNRVGGTLIPGGSVWNYSDAGQDLGTNWAQRGYDDSGWGCGPARLGYGDPTVATTVSSGTSSTNRNPTTYFRRWFAVPEGVQFTNLNLRLLSDDGAVVWLNGQEACRVNMPSGSITYTNVPVQALIQESLYTFNPTNLAFPNLVQGSNLLAVEVHVRRSTRSVVGFDLELLGSGYYPAPSLSIGRAGSNVVINWPVTNSSGYTLYWTTNLAANGAWIATTGAAAAGSHLVITQALGPGIRLFRLRRP